MYKLSMIQVISVFCTSFLPLLFWLYPRYAVQSAGIDGQWAVVGVVLLGLYVAWIHGLLNLRFPNISGADVPSKVYGRFLGKIITSMYMPGYVLFLSISVYSFSITLKSFLPLTPRLATVIGIVLVSALGAIYGLESIARVASIFFPVTLFVIFITYGFSLINSNLMGIYLHPVSITKTMYGSAQLLPVLFGINMFLLLSPYYDHLRRNSVWLPLIGMGISGSTLILVYLGTAQFVGFQGILVLTHPTEFVMQLVRVPGILIERFGVVLVILVTLFQGVFISNHLWGISLTISKVFDIEKKQKWLVLPVATAVVGIFIFIPNQQVGDIIVQRILVPLSWLYLIIEPTFKLLLSYVRRVGTAQPEKYATRREEESSYQRRARQSTSRVSSRRTKSPR